MEPVKLSDIQVTGDLMYRAERNFDRLEEEEYRIPGVFRSDPGAGNDRWPGDHEGRTILGLVMLAQATHREPKHLADILADLPAHMNAKGYIGRILDPGLADEQQMSGHSWLLRGLCEHYLWQRDQRARDAIEAIVGNLFLPSRNCYMTYPARPEERVFQGEASGNLTGKVYGNWYTSTDTGCAFIPLDGATHAYQVLGDSGLKALIDTMIEKYLSMDLVELSVQTHATLTGLRGILRYYECTQDGRLLDAARHVYSLYMSEGVTENYENYNWFARPKWTEPCAVIDSFMAAVTLWKNTGESSYLDDAHNILFNGMGYEQRPNGGWGLSRCAGAHDQFLGLREGDYEAWWCCTMRGGEGLARAVEYSYFVDRDSAWVTFFNNSTARLRFADGELTVTQSTDYPTGGNVRLHVVESTTAGPKAIMLFMPLWASAEDAHLSVNGRELPIVQANGFVEVRGPFAAGDVIEFRLDIRVRRVPIINRNSIAGHGTFRHGSLILGVRNHGEAISITENARFTHLGSGRYEVHGMGCVLEPINDLIYLSKAAVLEDHRQILFP